MSATLTSVEFNKALSLPPVISFNKETIQALKAKTSIVVSGPTNIESIITTPLATAYRLKVSNFTALVFEEEKPMSINTSAPLTLGWAAGLAATVLVGVLGIAGGTFALIHTDINDTRSEIKDLRKDSSDDMNGLRKDIRQDNAITNQKLDRINNVLNAIQIEQAKNQ